MGSPGQSSVSGLSNIPTGWGGGTRVKNKLPVIFLCLIGLYLMAFIAAVVFVFS